MSGECEFHILYNANNIVSKFCEVTCSDRARRHDPGRAFTEVRQACVGNILSEGVVDT